MEIYSLRNMGKEIIFGVINPNELIDHSMGGSIDFFKYDLNNTENLDLTPNSEPIIVNGVTILFEESGNFWHIQLISEEHDGAISSSSFGRTPKGQPYAFNNHRGINHYYDEEAIPKIDIRISELKSRLVSRGQLELGIFPSPELRPDEDPMA